MLSDVDAKDIRHRLTEVRREKEDAQQLLDAITAVEKGFEEFLSLVERESAPTVSMRSAVLQVLRSSKGEPLHVKEILRQVEALGALVRSSTNDKPSVIDIGIYSLKKQGLPVERVATRTWKYLGSEAIDFKKEHARKKRQRRSGKGDKNSLIGGEVTG